MSEPRVEYDEETLQECEEDNPAKRLRERPGFDRAVADARKRYWKIPEDVWPQVGECIACGLRAPITAEALLSVAIAITTAVPAPED